ncbi:MAG TPA: hypothetical protein VGI72_02065 [Gaiellales bacterium]
MSGTKLAIHTGLPRTCCHGRRVATTQSAARASPASSSPMSQSRQSGGNSMHPA